MIPNKSLHTNRRLASPFRMIRIIGHWIRCQQPLPAAVGELASEVIRQGLKVILFIS